MQWRYPFTKIFSGNGFSYSWHRYWENIINQRRSNSVGQRSAIKIYPRGGPVNPINDELFKFIADESSSTSPTTSTRSYSSTEASIGKECMSPNDKYGQWYRGKLNVTRSGLPCQKWTDQYPNKHTRTASL